MTETGELLKRTRDYLAANAAESGADVLLRELADAIERQAQELAEAKQKLAYTEASAADTAMRAHKWMVAHNMLAAGKPYDYPEPADLPNALDQQVRLRDQAQADAAKFLARAETAEAEIARLTAPLEGAKTTAEQRESARDLSESGAGVRPGLVADLVSDLTAATAQVRLAREAVEPSAAVSDVIVERRRQMEVEGWTIAHDDQHKNGEMAYAAAAYAVSGGTAENQRGRDDKLLAAIQFIWPRSWSWSWWKPKDRRRDLVRSAALLIAEIERLDRAAALAALRGEG